jgi:uncharacterized membrane protein YeaQ/YmgE (transglycosylase-associated protein family)
MTNFIAWLVVGGIVGWLASLIMGTNNQQGILLNIVVGIVGAFLGGLLISPVVGTSTINQQNFSMAAILIALLGSMLLLALLNVVRTGRAR